MEKMKKIDGIRVVGRGNPYFDDKSSTCCFTIPVHDFDICEPYRLLGQGCYGFVYAGLFKNQKVAVKLVPTSKKGRYSFHREVRISKLLGLQNIGPRVFNSGLVELCEPISSGYHQYLGFIVMEQLTEIKSLEHKQRKELLQVTCSLFDLGYVLSDMHRNNIMQNEQGCVRLIDFGEVYEIVSGRPEDKTISFIDFEFPTKVSETISPYSKWLLNKAKVREDCEKISQHQLIFPTL
jgi:predicted Ser/Thr protein kinase